MARYLGILLVSLVAFVFVVQPCEAAEKMKEYNIVAWFDLTGPSAPQTVNDAKGTYVWFGYWNKTIGKDLGIKLTLKVYDSQYNAAIVAARYPGVVASDRPIAMIYFGGHIAMSFSEKLPVDKIPGIFAQTMHGFMNKPYGWQFGALGTDAERNAFAVSYWKSQWKEKRPMRVAGIAFEGPGPEDSINGVKKYCETTPGLEFTVKELTPVKPVSLTTVVRRIIESKTDYVVIAHSGPGMAAFYNAMRELGVLGKIGVLNPPWFGVEDVKAQLGAEYAEGQFEAQAFDTTKTDNEAAKIFFENRDEFAKGTPWESATVWGFMSSSVLTQAIERALKKTGAENLSGQAIFDELNAGKFHGLGLFSDIQFIPENRLAGVTQMKVFQMKDGKKIDVTGFIPTPKIAKWY